MKTEPTTTLARIRQIWKTPNAAPHASKALAALSETLGDHENPTNIWKTKS